MIAGCKDIFQLYLLQIANPYADMPFVRELKSSIFIFNTELQSKIRSEKFLFFFSLFPKNNDLW